VSQHATPTAQQEQHLQQPAQEQHEHEIGEGAPVAVMRVRDGVRPFNLITGGQSPRAVASED